MLACVSFLLSELNLNLTNWFLFTTLHSITSFFLCWQRPDIPLHTLLCRRLKILEFGKLNTWLWQLLERILFYTSQLASLSYAKRQWIYVLNIHTENVSLELFLEIPVQEQYETIVWKNQKVISTTLACASRFWQSRQEKNWS